MPPKFFITHSWKDIDYARRLCDDLRANGLDGFFDAFSIQPGDDIAGRISKGLEDCDVYMPLLSPVAVASKWCELEIDTAIDLSMDSERNGRPRIIPIIIEPCKLPTLLRGRLYVDFHERYDDALRELLTEGFGLSVTRPTPPPPPKSAAVSLKLPWKNWQGPVGAVIVLLIIVLVIARAMFFPPLTTSAPPSATGLTPSSPTVVPTVAPVAVVATASPTIQIPTATPLSATSTGIPTATPIPGLGVGPTKTARDGSLLMFVPAGEFLMGSTRTASDNPQHTVYLDAFWIGKYDVTNALYKKCVDAGRCTAPYSWTDRNFPSGKENYPVAGVTWADAAAYAAWASARLPTEAEWEKAACWDEAKKAKRLYPWGNEFDRQKANTSGSLNYGTSPVGKYSPEGDSPYGLSDMAGNVWNWVADWYSDTYYSNPPLRNPKGADTGVERVMRGGSWYAINLNAQCPYRGRSDPSLRLDTIGFRIATSAP